MDPNVRYLSSALGLLVPLPMPMFVLLLDADDDDTVAASSPSRMEETSDGEECDGASG